MKPRTTNDNNPTPTLGMILANSVSNQRPALNHAATSVSSSQEKPPLYRIQSDLIKEEARKKQNKLQKLEDERLENYKKHQDLLNNAKNLSMNELIKAIDLLPELKEPEWVFRNSTYQGVPHSENENVLTKIDQHPQLSNELKATLLNKFANKLKYNDLLFSAPFLNRLIEQREYQFIIETHLIKKLGEAEAHDILRVYLENIYNDAKLLALFKNYNHSENKNFSIENLKLFFSKIAHKENLLIFAEHARDKFSGQQPLIKIVNLLLKSTLIQFEHDHPGSVNKNVEPKIDSILKSSQSFFQNLHLKTSAFDIYDSYRTKRMNYALEMAYLKQIDSIENEIMKQEMKP